MHRLTRWPCADDGVAALVVTYLNLAEVLLRDGDEDEACNLTCGLHRSLIDAADSGALTSPLREAARKHLHQSFAAVVRLQQRLGPRPGITRLLFLTSDGDMAMTTH